MEPPLTMNGSAYTAEQTSQYLEYISLPSQYTPSSPKDINFLTTLHRHQISTIPYDNLSLHYYPHAFASSPPTAPSLAPASLFKKFVENKRGRGGYCMEVSIFFNHVLRALGFAAYMTGVRIRHREGGVPGGRYIGWVHIINIVTLPDGTRWMCDVGFGGDGATRPVPMIRASGDEEKGVEAPVFKNLGSQEIRLVYKGLPAEHADSVSGQKWWIYQYRNTEVKPWNSFYCFGEQEFLAPDFGIMNHYTGTCLESFQTFTVLIVKFLRRKTEDGDGTGEEIHGKAMMVDGTVKLNMGGKTEIVKVCKTEEERVEALGKYFGIKLTEEERVGIRGRVTDLGIEKK